MEDKVAGERDWWLWQMYRQVASLINNPSESAEAKLKALIFQYRTIYGDDNIDSTDPHERLMDYR